MDKTDLSLILGALSVLLSLGLGVVAILIVIAFLAGVLVGQRLVPRP